MESITSSANSYFKRMVALKQKKYRYRERLFLAEGRKNIEVALESGFSTECLFVGEGCLTGPENRLAGQGLFKRVITVPEELLAKLTDTVTPQKLVAVFAMPEKKQSRVDGATALFLNNIQDPGNLGAIIRIAVAAGIDTIVLDEGCADFYSSKVIRASAGTVFINLPATPACAVKWLDEQKKQGWAIIGTALDETALDYRRLPVADKKIIVLGNEGSGIEAAILARCDYKAVIPLRNGVESLNVAAAAAILLFSPAMWQAPGPVQFK